MEPEYLILAFVAIILFVAGIFLTRWVLAINHFVASSKKQINLLILIAKKNGATDEEVLDVIRKAEEGKG